ncbi:MAG: PIN domain-containing protein [Prevotella sp.]|nr:PIN domain-containing protein [Prevotella sp.]
MGRLGKMKAFIDTNVLLDNLAMREGFYEDAATIFSMVKDGYIEGIVSSLSIINCAYVLPKHYERKNVMELIHNLIHLFSVSDITIEVLLQATNRNPHDFEDAVQYFSSLQYFPDIIITRDKKGFKEFNLPVFTPSEFIAESKK